MFHLNTEQLIDYWRAGRRGGSIPLRTSIDPTEISNLLPQIFMLGRRGLGQYHFRLVGGFVADLHGCDLRQDNMMALWRADDRAQVQSAIESIRRRGEPVVINSDAHSYAGPSVQMEITLAPLIGPSGDVDRLMGFYQPTSPVSGLMGRPALNLSVRDMATPGAARPAFPPLRLAAVGGQRVA